MARRPFYETIVDKIRACEDNYDHLRVLGDLILVTDIPRNHDAIISALEASFEETDGLEEELGIDRVFFESVLADLKEQKREAEEDARQAEVSRADAALLRGIATMG